MNFLLARQFLENVFLKNDFENDLRKGLNHQKEHILNTCSNGSEISVSFPGYKAQIDRGKIVYDYRIDIKKNGIKTALSHVNIVTDIYNKLKFGKLFPLAMSNALISLSKLGSIDIPNWKSELRYKSLKPNTALLDLVERSHPGKVFNRLGNSFDLDLEEMFVAIKWIVIQEDINYPISKGFEGRRMSFARYLETVFVSQNDQYEFSEVIERALSHKRPIKWSEMDYSFLEEIV